MQSSDYMAAITVEVREFLAQALDFARLTDRELRQHFTLTLMTHRPGAKAASHSVAILSA